MTSFRRHCRRFACPYFHVVIALMDFPSRSCATSRRRLASGCQPRLGWILIARVILRGWVLARMYRENKYMLNSVTLDQNILRTFIAAADEGSFSGAGQRLGRARSPSSARRSRIWKGCSV